MDVVKALGAVPVPLEMPDVYESLRRAVIDGVMVDLSTLKYWKFAEVNKYVTACWQLGTDIPSISRKQKQVEQFTT
jgi:TRAP-type C4-dicarboxylate transport system substrate-binding protein